MSIELKPCPFCGGEARVDEDYAFVNGERAPRFIVWCTECFIGTAPRHAESFVINRWNTRAERTCRIERRESMWGGYTEHCSECGADFGCDTRNRQHYCPNCGAKVVE